MIVFEDADLDGTVEGVVDAIFFNQGQVSPVAGCAEAAQRGGKRREGKQGAGRKRVVEE